MQLYPVFEERSFIFVGFGLHRYFLRRVAIIFRYFDKRGMDGEQSYKVKLLAHE